MMNQPDAKREDAATELLRELRGEIAAKQGILPRAADEIKRLLKELEEAKADQDRISRNRDMWKGQVKRQAETIASMR
jgi:uncharacterized protein HemX